MVVLRKLVSYMFVLAQTQKTSYLKITNIKGVNIELLLGYLSI